MSAERPLLQVCDVSFSIGERRIVEGLTFEVEAGTALGFVGPNGAGKTTAIDLISGLSQPASGSVLLDGVAATGLPPSALVRFGLTRTFQESPAVRGLSVTDHLRLAAEATARQRMAPTSVPELLERFHLVDVADEEAARLPVSRRRMVDFARAVATQPKVLLLDEPFAGLGREDLERVTAEIARFKRAGSALVVVDHRLDILNRVADTALALVAGFPVARGSLEEVLATPVVREAFLGRDPDASA